MAFSKLATLAAVAALFAFSAPPAFADDHGGMEAEATEAAAGGEGSGNGDSKLSMGDPEAGKQVARKCMACHTFDEGAPHRVGPNQYGVLARPAGTSEDYRYSDDFKKAAEEIGMWEYDELMAYLEDPSGYLTDVLGERARGKMTYRLPSEEERKDVIAYLNTLK
jgi:cytochrome c